MRLATTLAAALALLAPAAHAAPADGLTVGGYVQFLYTQTDPAAAPTAEELEINRLRLELSGKPIEGWEARVAFDLGRNAADPTVRDAWIRWTGAEWGTVTIGNQYVPFSREQTTADKRQQLIERTLAGDHDFGTPDRQVGVLLASKPGTFTWQAGVFRAGLDRGTDRLDFDTSANVSADYFGTLLGGRVEWFPLGHFAQGQGDFERVDRFAIGVNAYSWSGGGTPTQLATDWDSATGLGVDVAWRGRGWSLDLEHGRYDAETLDGTSTVGLAVAGEASLRTTALEGGWMFPGNAVELVGAVERMSAEAWAQDWQRRTIGLNWYLDAGGRRSHDLKLQLNFASDADARGVTGADVDSVRLQMQLVFK